MAEELLKKGEIKGGSDLPPKSVKRKRLVSKEEVERIFRSGTKIVSEKMVLLHLENQSEYFRYAIHTRKKLGHAVERNRTRRLFREALLRQGFLSGQDLIIIPRKEVKGLSLKEITDHLAHVFRRAGIIQKK